MKLSYKDLIEGILNVPIIASRAYISTNTSNAAEECAGKNWVAKNAPRIHIDDSVPDGYVRVEHLFKWDQSPPDRAPIYQFKGEKPR